MNWIIKRLVKFFFNRYYRIRPPEAVGYWKNNDVARARLTTAPEGHFQMEVEGEKYPIAGFPRGHVLTGPLAKLKHKMKNMIFNQIFEEMEKMAEEVKMDMVPPEKMVPAVKELWRGLELVENAEVADDMKKRIQLIKKVICFFFQEDDAYRFRFQWLLERLDMKKIKLTKGDKYYFRGKYFKVDHDVYDY